MSDALTERLAKLREMAQKPDISEDVADAILASGFHRIPPVEDIAKIVASRRGVTARVNDTDREVARAVIARIEAGAWAS